MQYNKQDKQDNNTQKNNDKKPLKNSSQLKINSQLLFPLNWV